MSKKITHEQAKNELATFRGIADYSYNQLWLYIKQQEKQEKLLKLYRKLNYVRIKKDLAVDELKPKVKQEILDIQKQIQELENE